MQPLKNHIGKRKHSTSAFIEPQPTSEEEDSSVLVFVDRISKRIHAGAFLKNPSAAKATQLFQDDIFKFHVLHSISICDKDTDFMRNFWDSLFYLQQTKTRLSSSYHLKTGDQTEIVNRKIEECIRAYVNFDKSEWEL